MREEIEFQQDCLWWKVKIYFATDFFHWTKELGFAVQFGRMTRTCEVLAQNKEQAYEIAAKAAGWWGKEGFRRGGARYKLDGEWHKP